MTVIAKIMNRQQRRPTPISARLPDGTLISHNGDAWLYMVMPLVPLVWEDHDQQMAHAQRLHAMLTELGSHSRGSAVPGMKMGAHYREFHMVSLAWDEPPRTPDAIHPQVRQWLDPVFAEFDTGAGLFAVGVKLRTASAFSASGFVSTIRNVIAESTARTPDRGAFAADRALVGPIVARGGGKIPSDDQIRRLETWWNGGVADHLSLHVTPDGRSVAVDFWPEGLEFSALMEFSKFHLNPSHGLWLADAFGHHDGCVAVSLRGTLVPASVARNDFRKSQRKASARIGEQDAAGDLQRQEDHDLLDTAAKLESMYADADEPLVRWCSIVFARRASRADTTFATMLEQSWGVKSKVVEHRQIEAMEETLPCGVPRIGASKVFSRDLTVGMIAASGIGAFNDIGDSEGVWIGTAPPDHSLVWLDPQGASKENKPPSMGVVGEPGAGKTFLLQLIATQATQMGLPVVFINPKSADTLGEFADAVGGETIKVSSLQREPGLLDPFRYCTDTEIACEIALAHINTVMVSIPEKDRILMAAGVRQAAEEGAQCVGDALSHPRVPQEWGELVKLAAQSQPLFGLGISMKPRGTWDFTTSGRLTLVEFDRPIPIPETITNTALLNSDERAAVAAIRLITRAALEQMFRGGIGGVLIVDEAHMFLSSQEGRNILQNLGRTGRSQGILPIMATQRLADLIADGVDMTSYMGRAFIMKMTDPKETDAALALCGLEATDDRRDFLRKAGPIHDRDDPSRSRGALALHRDLNDRVSAVLVGPVPEEVRMRFSTNLLDRAARKLAG